MNQFIDSKKRAHALEITIGTALKVREAIGVDLLNPTDKTDNGDPLSTRLLYDDVFLGVVCYHLLADQLAEKEISKDDFLNALDGESTKRLDKAFWDEYRFFFQARGKEWIVEATKLDEAARDDALAKTLASVQSSVSTGGASTNLQVVPDSETLDL